LWCGMLSSRHARVALALVVVVVLLAGLTVLSSGAVSISEEEAAPEVLSHDDRLGFKVTPGDGEDLYLGGSDVLQVQVKDAYVEEEEITVEDVVYYPEDVMGRTVAVHGLAARPSVQGSMPTVLLLHGQSYSAETWRELGTLELLAKEGFRAIALDLPSLQDLSGTSITTDTFLWSLTATYPSLKNIVVVSPSMSGSFAIPFLEYLVVTYGSAFRSPPTIVGWVALAPVSVHTHAILFPSLDIPALLMFGENDEKFRKAGSALLEIPNNDYFLVPNAGHACYRDNPEFFHSHLFDYLAKARAFQRMRNRTGQ